MNYSPINDTRVIEQLDRDYLHTLVAPMDGMWESAVIAQASFWEIRASEQSLGYFCVDENRYLLRFHLFNDYLSQAQQIFRWLLSTCNIQFAIASTIEPLYFSLCLDLQINISPHTYLFRDHKRVELSSQLDNGIFRKAEQRELADIINFYYANAQGAGAWIEAFVKKLLNREELFLLFDRRTLVATGECIPSQKKASYADLGMIVAQSHRGRGLGSFMLSQLKKHCYQFGWQPICSCTSDNLASKRAIEKAGFISEQRMVKVLFPQ